MYHFGPMPDERKRIVAVGYDLIAPRYATWSKAIQDDPRDRMVDAFSGDLPDGGRVLDLGCGAGVGSTDQLARRFRVVGIDASAAQVEQARRNVPDAEFIHGDFTEVVFPDGSFDGVVALYSIIHVPREEHPALFAKVYRWLVPGGLFLATLGTGDTAAWTGDWLGGEMFFSSYLPEQSRAQVQAAGFEVWLDEIVDTREPEGDVSFLWVIGRKHEVASSHDR
jgi:cyclopropane fatty-acyl-phospholipid synthase-like methyltransferase